MNPATICFPEFFLYLAAEVRRNQFHGTSSEAASKKSFLEILPYLRSHLQSLGLMYSEMPVPALFSNQIIKYYITIKKLQSRDTVE